MEKTVSLQPGKAASVSGRVPNGAAFFQDHFPDFPVLPGVLAVEILKRTAELCLEKKDLALARVSQVKFSSYLKPGDSWESRVELADQQDGQSEWKGKLFQGERLAVSAKFVLNA